MFYFAYGSNLSPARLQKRVPSAEFIATGLLTEHRLLFHKIGLDGTAKCNACFTGQSGDHLYGAVYRIDPAHKKHLDQAEGLGRGYEIKDVTIYTPSLDKITAFTYFATRTAVQLKPFSWYREHVLQGAHEHLFPPEYIAQIGAIETIEDPDPQRTEKELAIYTVDPDIS